ncbi:MAG: DUF4012 domain-containing protein, partial [bacterium]
KHKKRNNIVLIVFVVMLFLYNFLFVPTASLLRRAKNLPDKIRPVKLAMARQDLNMLGFEFEYLRGELVLIGKDVDKLKFFSFVPWVGSYIKDAKTISDLSIDILDTAEGLLLSLGESIPDLTFSGWGSSQEIFTDDALSELTAVSSALSEELPKYKEEFRRINEGVGSINIDKYPEEFKGMKIREMFMDLKNATSMLSISFDDIVEFISIMPDLVGARKTKNYLIILQNDKVLRPSGGVLSAYSVFSVGGGGLQVTKSGDMLMIDAPGKNVLCSSPSRYIREYLGTSCFYIRDAGFSSDYKVSGDKINELWSKIPGTFPVDGILVLDTHFISSLVRVVGNLSIDGFEEDITEDTVVEQLVTFFGATGSHASENMKQKDLTGALLYELMKKLFSSTNRQRIELAKIIGIEAKEKHILFYFKDTRMQTFIEKYGAAGRVKDYEGDYLYISEANVGNVGGNANIRREIKKEINISDGAIVSNITLKYKNEDLSDYSYKAYVRVYVPKGSSFEDSSILSLPIETGEDLGKTYFGFLIDIPKEGEKEISLKYKLPTDGIVGLNKAYKLLIQKQPGLDSVSYEVFVNGDKKESVELVTDKELEFSL